jgi:hypothetical protein
VRPFAVVRNFETGTMETIMIVDAFTVFGALLAGLIVAALFYVVKRRTL